MPHRIWRRIAWVYHILFAIAVTWPVQALVNDPEALVLGLPGPMAWITAWVAGSLPVLWRLDAARIRERAATRASRAGAAVPTGD